MLALIVLLVLAVYYESGPAAASLSVKVASSDNSGINGAVVSLYSATGQLLASSATVNGIASFAGLKVPPGQQVVRVVVSKSGYQDPSGNPNATTIVQVGKSAGAIVFLYPSGTATPTGAAGITLVTVLDAATLSPISGAVVLSTLGDQITSSTTGQNGTAAVPSEAGQPLKLRTSADGYYADSRYVIAQDGQGQTVKLEPKNPPAQQGANPGFTGPAVLSDSQPIINASSTPLQNVTLTFYDSDGSLLNGTLTIIDPNTGLVIFTGQIVDGQVLVPDYPPDGILVARNQLGQIVGTGTVTVTDLDGNQLFTQPIYNGQSSQAIYPDLTVTVQADDSTTPASQLNVYDTFTGSLLQTIPVTGQVILSSIGMGQQITLEASAPGYYPALANTVFGDQPAITLQLKNPPATAMPTIFNVTDATTGNPMACHVRVYSSVFGLAPVDEFDIAAGQPPASAELDPSNAYYAVISAGGYYTPQSPPRSFPEAACRRACSRLPQKPAHTVASPTPPATNPALTTPPGGRPTK